MKKKDKETLFENILDDVFLKSLAKNERPKTKKVWKGDYFYIFSSSKEKVFYKYYFELHDNFIFCRKKQDSSKEIAFMDVNFAFMKKSKKTTINGIPHYGIKFIKKKTYEEIFSKSEETVN